MFTYYAVASIMLMMCYFERSLYNIYNMSVLVYNKVHEGPALSSPDLSWIVHKIFTVQFL